MKALDLERPRSRGPQPEPADSALITIELVGEFRGLDADNDSFRHFRADHTATFPALGRVSRATFARQTATRVDRSSVRS